MSALEAMDVLNEGLLCLTWSKQMELLQCLVTGLCIWDRFNTGSETLGEATLSVSGI